MDVSKCLPCFLFLCYVTAVTCQVPIVIATWGMTINATREAYRTLTTSTDDDKRMDALENGIGVCDLQKDCGVGIGPHDKPNENGEVTLDAMVMDGETMDVGAVGCLRWVANAVGVARAITKYTESTFLVGSDASEFAAQMGFTKENISLGSAPGDYETWLNNNCQPNRWKEGAVTPEPTQNCGPYEPAITRVQLPESPRRQSATADKLHAHMRQADSGTGYDKTDHDTIGMVVVDDQGRIASGTSTNGLKHKIAGRVGDSPIPGAGSYSEKGVGAAATTGDGDISLKMLPTFHAVALLQLGRSPQEAADRAVSRVMSHFPEFGGAVIVVTPSGEYGASCSKLFGTFNYTIQHEGMADAEVKTITCMTQVLPEPTTEPTTAPPVECSASLVTPTLVFVWVSLFKYV